MATFVSPAHQLVVKQLRARYFRGKYTRLRHGHDIEFLACDCPPTAKHFGVPVRPVIVTSRPNNRKRERVICLCGVVSLIANPFMQGSILLGREPIRRASVR